MKKVSIPEKTYFKIGEVAKLLDVEPYVLRYWETEFDALKPEKTRTGQRSYRRADIELLLKIQHLLYEEEYTISGARRQLRQMKKRGESELPEQTVLRLEDELQALRDELEPLKNDVGPLHKKIGALEKENSAVKAAYRELEKTRDNLQSELANGSVVEAMAEERSQLEESLVESRRLVGRQAGELSKLKAENETLRDEIVQMRTSMQTLASTKVDSSELEALEQRLADALERIDDLQSQKTSLDRDSAQLSQASLRRMVNLRRELEGLARMAN